MDFSLNGRIGGAGDVQSAFHRLLVDARPVAQAEFTGVIAPDLAEVRAFVLVNADVSTYYASGGVFKPRYSEPTQRITVDLCFAEDDVAVGAPLQVAVAEAFGLRLQELVAAIETVERTKRLSFGVADVATACERVTATLIDRYRSTGDATRRHGEHR